MARILTLGSSRVFYSAGSSTPLTPQHSLGVYIGSSPYPLLRPVLFYSGRWLFIADDPQLDEGFGLKFFKHKVYNAIGLYRLWV